MQQQFFQLQQQMTDMNFQQSFFQPQNSKNNQNPVHSNGFFENNKKRNAKNIGYFDFDYDGKKPVIDAGKNVYYKNVYVFIQRFKNMKFIHDMKKFRTVLPQCYKKSVFIWHFTEISERNKRFYRTVSFEK